jgi:hypothetical protein
MKIGIIGAGYEVVVSNSRGLESLARNDSEP